MATRWRPWAVVLVGLLALVIIGGAWALSRGAMRRPEDPNGPATFVGSLQCRGCHDGIYATWQQTVHSKVIQDVSERPGAILGDFTLDRDRRGFDKDDVAVTHGVQWKQRYINQDWKVLPFQWNFEAEDWSPYHEEDWQERDWRRLCASCHVVGYNPETNDWKELSVGCEACHGPGSKHVNADPENRSDTIVNPALLTPDMSADVCGQCHTRGKTPDGKFNYPVGYTPGMKLLPEHFTPVPKTDEEAWWPDGSVKQHRQQFLEWKESRHRRAGVTCTDCHAVHERPMKFNLRMSQNNLCISCHSSISTDPEDGHAPIEGAPQHADCIACHMAPTGKSATRGDERVHLFRVVEPRVTVELGGGDPDKQPNACNLCHAHKDDDPARLQTALDQGLQRRSDAPVEGPKRNVIPAD